MHKKTQMAIWIPVILAIISSLTTIAVTYIQATAKAQNYNVMQEVKERRHGTGHLRPDRNWTVQTPFKRASVNFSVKGFTVSTNN
jgi:hypothetical protein